MNSGKEGCFVSSRHTPGKVSISGLKGPGKISYWEYNCMHTSKQLDMYKNDKLPLTVNTKNPTQEHDYYTINTILYGEFGYKASELTDKLFKKDFPFYYCPYIAYAK